VVLGGDGLAEFSAGEFTDHYVKLIFPPPGAPYDHPVDPEAVEARHPREWWPVTRAYTVRSWDAGVGELTIDVVHHGGEGIAPVWAAAARPGDSISMFGPGGSYRPAADAEWHLLVGDESALPAIAATVESLPPDAEGVVLVEVAGQADEQPLTGPDGVTVTWIHRETATDQPGAALAEAARDAAARGGDLQAFVHGEADMVRAVRRHLRVGCEVPHERLSASGYWRRGRTDEGWRAEKKDWNAAVEADEISATPE
jgi:NADPH-dependent ferric siderophore reductase